MSRTGPELLACLQREQLPPAWQPRRIAIFRALSVGDLLVAVPALRAIRHRFPQAEITLVGLPWAKEFVRRYQRYLDRFVEFQGYPGIQEVPYEETRSQAFLRAQQAYGYDLVIQMHGNGRTSDALALEFRAEVTVGYYDPAYGKPEGLTVGAPYPDDVHEIYRNLGLAAMLGCQQLDPRLEFPLYEQDHAEATALLRALPRAERPWIALHTGARPSARRWPAEYFARVGDTLARTCQAQILLTGSQGEEETVATVAALMQTHPISLVGQTSLGALGALLSKLDLFITNDTGPAHIAYAVGCPSITLFGPADYHRWQPLDQEKHKLVRRPVVCSPCSYWSCPIDHRCMRWLDPARVFDLAERQLRAAAPALRSPVQVQS